MKRSLWPFELPRTPISSYRRLARLFVLFASMAAARPAAALAQEGVASQELRDSVLTLEECLPLALDNNRQSGIS